MKQKRTTISGLAGTGKATISKILSKKLNYEFISIGYFSRDFVQTEY